MSKTITSKTDKSQDIKDEPEENSAVPVTIITGFLGAGKTTLLNHILTNQKGIKTAVLVNEFGEIGIDNELIVTTQEEVVELSNGCICCSINGELLEAVNRILDRPERIDYIIVETTGLADPLPVAMTFLGSELRDLTRLDSIITLIDAENFNDQILDSEVGRSQIIYGDILLLNKCDVVTNERLVEIENKLGDIKQGPRILRSVESNIALPLIMSVGLFETDRFNKTKSQGKHNQHEHEHGHGHKHEHGHGHGHKHEHGQGSHNPDHLDIEGFTSLSFESNSPFALRKFQNFLDNKLPSGVFRAKGILWFNESSRRHVFHLAGKRFSLDDSDWEGEKKNQLVLIGKELDHETLRTQLKACVAINADKGFI